MAGWYQAIRPLLFRVDPERAHSLAFLLLRAWQRAVLTRGPTRPWTHPMLSQSIWGVDFVNPVGLAAGFDKNAALPHLWGPLGFGFAELGTVTALPQPGNPRPRLFRLPSDRALINRLGFNNVGAEAVAASLTASLRSTPAAIPLGINLGKSRVTAIDAAAADYTASFRQLARFAAYVVINVSSPNTPGLRDLQGESHLAALLDALHAENARLIARGEIKSAKPLLVKIAPDLTDDSLADIVRVVRDHGGAGLVATNTTVARTGLTARIDEVGGLSGAPLRQRATEVVRHLRGLAGSTMPIIGVGGIFSAADAYEKIRAGACLVQVYTGFIYEGPFLAQTIARDLVALLTQDDCKHLRDAIGRAA